MGLPTSGEVHTAESLIDNPFQVGHVNLCEIQIRRTHSLDAGYLDFVHDR